MSKGSGAQAAAREAMLREYCRELRMPAVLRQCAELARQARDGGWQYEEFLLQLLEAGPLPPRSRRGAALKRSHFPEVKTFEQVDWSELKGISRPKLTELMSCAYIDRHEDLILAGPIGTRKTHSAIALGVEGGASALPGRLHTGRGSGAPCPS
ncbi:MAG: ATP-binding protein [Candidatus Binatia bacterium]